MLFKDKFLICRSAFLKPMVGPGDAPARVDRAFFGGDITSPYRFYWEKQELSLGA